MRGFNGLDRPGLGLSAGRRALWEDFWRGCFRLPALSEADGAAPAPVQNDAAAVRADGMPGAAGATGVTMVIDKGLPLGHFVDLLDLAAPFVQLWKLAFGTAALYPLEEVARKVAAARARGVEVYPGGTFLELARVSGDVGRMLDRLWLLGIRWIEVSEGTYDMTPRERRELIARAVGQGFEVVTEVGSKDPARAFEARRAADQVAADLAAGARYVIVEARDSGRGVGVFDPQGRLKADLLEQMVEALGDPSRIIWEAPQPEQQRELLLRFGPSVGLGNVQAGDVLLLAAMRLGLRSDTMRAWLPSVDGRGGHG